MVGREDVKEGVHDGRVRRVPRELERPRVAHDLRQVEVGVREGQVAEVVCAGGETRREYPAVEAVAAALGVIENLVTITMVIASVRRVDHP